MASEEKASGSPWIWATVIFGLFGVVSTTPILNRSTSTTKPEGNTLPSPAVDHSDDIYPSPVGAISKKLGPWEDPFEPIASKLKFEPKATLEPNARKDRAEPEAPIQTSILEIIQSQLSENGKGSPGRLVVMVKVVEGKDTDSGVESRRRHRHAVELAMASAGYSMPYPDRMTYVNAEYDYFHTRDKFNSISIDVPIKLYKKRLGPAGEPGKNQLALIAWVRNEHLGERPLSALSQITQNIISQDSTLYSQAALAILGPSSSDRLSKMVAEHTLPAMAGRSASSVPDFFKKWRYGAMLYNSSCTASNSGIGLKECQRHIVLDENSRLPIAHTIGEDSLLIKRLIKELQLRGRSSRTVLFVEEQSQKYINELKDSFKQAAEDVVVVPYLRDISKTEKQEHSVLDYLKRTFSELKSDQVEAVSAVGVFGTQTADKMSIFREAREAFPTAAFFTTELDARYSDAQNYNDCRNLLVASHFGLSCKTELFGGSSRTMPTFRDGYQTSAFLATLIALQRFETTLTISDPDQFLNGDQDLYNLWSRPANSQGCSDAYALEPLMFEISRSGNYQFPISDRHVHTHVVSNAIDRQPLFSQYWFIPRLFFAMLLVVAICLVARLYSSELARALQSTALMLKSVGDFFRALLWRGWRLAKRLTATSTHVPPNKLPLTKFRAALGDENLHEGQLRGLIGFVVWFVLVSVTSVILFNIAWISDISHDGEPVTWTDSISIWPSVLLFHCVSCVSSYLILRYVRSNPDVALKGFALALLLGALIVCVMGTSVRDAPPARGEITRTAASISLRAAAAWLFCLASLSSLSIMKARKEISSELKSELQIDVDGATLSKRAEELLTVSSRFHALLGKAMCRGEDSSVTLIAPAALTIVLAIARLPLLDSWGVPRVWYVALMTPMLLSVVAALLMRSEARHLKSEAVEKLETYQSMLLGQYARENERPILPGNLAIGGPSPEIDQQRFNDCIAKVGLNIGLINRLNRGPFGSVYSDPLLGGLLLLITAGLTGPMREQTISLLSLLHLT